jgi:pimeloyl-ACP methyl ester carboxylesterase
MIFLANLLWIVLALGIFILLYAIYYFYSSLKPARFITPVNPSHFGLAWETISFKTCDELNIMGWFIPSPVHPTSAAQPDNLQAENSQVTQSAMIICHGYPFDKGNVLPMIKFLHTQCHLFLFDFRAMGESDGNLTTAGYLEREDIRAAIDFLETKGIKDIGIWGLSMGAATALMASQDSRVKAIIADSPYASMDKLLDELLRNLFFMKKPFKALLKKLGEWLLKIELSQVHPERTVQNAQKPIFIIHGDQDSQVHLSHSLMLKKANPNIQLWIVKDAHHGEAHQLYPEEYEKKVREFLNQSFTTNSRDY